MIWCMPLWWIIYDKLEKVRSCSVSHFIIDTRIWFLGLPRRFIFIISDPVNNASVNQPGQFLYYWINHWPNIILMVFYSFEHFHQFAFQMRTLHHYNLHQILYKNRLKECKMLKIARYWLLETIALKLVVPFKQNLPNEEFIICLYLW